MYSSIGRFLDRDSQLVFAWTCDATPRVDPLGGVPTLDPGSWTISFSLAMVTWSIPIILTPHTELSFNAGHLL